MEKMKKDEMISKVSEESGLSKKDIDSMFKAYVKVVEEGIMSGMQVPLPSIGHFEKGEAKAKEAYINPRQKELGRKTVPAHSVLKFRKSDSIKKAVK